MIVTDFDRLMNDVRARLPGALDSALKQELFAVLDEFFQDSGVWQEKIPLTTIAGEQIYDLESEQSSAMPIGLLGLHSVDGGHPIPATMGVVGELVLRDPPPAGLKLEATVALTCDEPVRTDDFPRCPAWVIKKYRAALVDGLLSRLMSQPAKPYSNERLAIYHARRFRNAIGKAIVDARRANLHGGQAWRFPQNFATGR